MRAETMSTLLSTVSQSSPRAGHAGSAQRPKAFNKVLLSWLLLGNHWVYSVQGLNLGVCGDVGPEPSLDTAASPLLFGN